MTRTAALLAALALALAAAPALAQRAEPTDPRLLAAQANVRLGLEYLRQGEVANARDKIQRALEQYPRDVGVQLGAALLQERLGEPARAERHYRTALRVDGKSPEAQNALGTFLCRSGKHAPGEEMLLKAARNALSRQPDVLFVNAGVCARAGGRLDAAEQHFRQALSLRPSSREALGQLASVSFDKGAHLPARAFVQRFLAAGAAAPEVLLIGVKVETALGDAEAAAGYRRRLLQEFPGSAEAAQLAAGEAPRG